MLTRRAFCAATTAFLIPQPSEARTMIPQELYYYRPSRESKPERLDVDVCIYGGTAAGIITAIQLRKLGWSVIVLEQNGQIGGMTTGGLSYTDFGNKAVIGGMAREFYRRMGKHYGVEEEWKFEPHVAEQTLNAMVQEAGVEIRYRQFLKSVVMEEGRIKNLITERGLTVHAKIFVDATYEGDLMAKAGVGYHVGREANKVYGETLNGAQVLDKHQFDLPVDPYVVEGNPASGLLPGVTNDTVVIGKGDKRVQAYNFRLCLTQEASNRVPFAKPEGYNRAEFVLLERYLKAGSVNVFGKFDPIQGKKVDKNNHGAISTDFIGRNWSYPTGSYRVRQRIFHEHVVYQMGLFWFLSNDSEVPKEIRERMNTWGLCKDEFTPTGGWSFQMYIREGRRMVSDYVMTEHHCKARSVAEDSVGLGSYNMDSHNCRRFVRDGKVLNEGDVQVGAKPYPISYRAIVPRKQECTNLFVPVCLSSSHIAYGSIRMEPVFMILGQSSALAAHIALTNGIAVQDVSYKDLRPLLETAKQTLEWKPSR